MCDSFPLERQFDALDEELHVLLDVPREPNGWELTRDDADYEPGT